MQKAHANQNWENFPSINTPINEQNLNKLDRSVDEIDDRVIALDTSKFNLSDAQGLLKSLTFNQTNGVFTITYFNGSTATIDTMLEKLAVNFDFDEDAQQMIIILDDGTEKRVDLSAFIKPIEFIDSGTIAWQLLDDGQVSAIVKEGSIEEKHLRPDYLADIKVQAATASAAATAAQASKDSSDASAASALDSKNAASASASAAQLSAQSAATSESNAEQSKNAAAQSAQNALTSENNTKASENAAKESEENAKESENNAASSGQIASEKASEAADSALLSESFAHGKTGIRENEDTDNADFYCQNAHGYRDEAEQFSKSANGAVEQINKKLKIARFSIDDNANLIYTDDSAYRFRIDDDGMLNWEVVV